MEDENGQFRDLQPVCKSLNSQFEVSEFGEYSGLINQDSLLERNLNAALVDALALIEEGSGSIEEELNEDLMVEGIM